MKAFLDRITTKTTLFFASLGVSMIVLPSPAWTNRRECLCIRVIKGVWI